MGSQLKVIQVVDLNWVFSHEIMQKSIQKFREKFVNLSKEKKFLLEDKKVN